MRLEQWLSETGMSQAAFGRRVGCDPSLIGKWIRREVIPGPKNMTGIYRVTDGLVSPNDFYDLPRIRRTGSLDYGRFFARFAAAAAFETEIDRFHG